MAEWNQNTMNGQKMKRSSLVLLDQNIYDSKECQEFIQRCATSNFTLFRFSDGKKFIEFLRAQLDDEIFTLIISDNLYDYVVPHVHSDVYLNRIYVHHGQNTTEGKQKLFNHEKVQNKQPQSLQYIYEELMIHSQIPEKPITNISFVGKEEIQNIDHQDPTFMYQQLLKDILLHDYEFDSDAIARKKMVEYCREICEKRPSQKSIIDEFEEKFHPNDAFYWYTRECFLYEAINNALRTPDPVALYKLRYFIRHLHAQILLVDRRKDSLNNPMIVFRGQGISKDQLNQLRSRLGGLISFSNFLSTSLNRKVGLCFSNRVNRDADEVSVLFEMKIDSNMRSSQYVCLGEKSYFGVAEDEVLFSAGAVFRIHSINQVNGHLWIILLSLSDDTDHVLAYYTGKMRQKIRSAHPINSLVRLMDEMGQYKLLDDFVHLSADDQSILLNLDNAASLEHAFGGAYYSAGNHVKALSHFQKALSICSRFLPSNHPQLSPTYNNMGSIYKAEGDHENALIHYKRALEFQLDSSEPNLNWIIVYHNNIALLYESTGQNKEALDHFRKASELQQQYFNNHHPDLSRIYSCMARLYQKTQDYQNATRFRQMADVIDQNNHNPRLESQAETFISSGRSCLETKEYSTAEEHFKRAIDLQQKYLLPNHRSITNTYNGLAHGYFIQERYTECLGYYEKMLELQRSSLADDHPTIAVTYHNLSTDYAGMEQYNKGLEYAHKAVQQCRKRTDHDCAALQRYIDNIGTILNQQGRHVEALSYFEESLAIDEKRATYKEDELLNLYCTIGSSYQETNQFEKALSFYQKALNIALLRCTDEPEKIIRIHLLIADVYRKMFQYDNALINLQEATTILRKKPNGNKFISIGLLFNLADMLQQYGNYQESIRIFTESLSLVLQVMNSENTFLVIMHYYRLGTCHEQLQQYTEAASYYHIVLDIERETPPNDHPMLATIYERLASVYSAMQDHDRTLKYAQNAVHLLRKQIDSDSMQLGRCLYMAGNALQNQGKHAQARRYLEEYLAVHLSTLAEDHPSLAVTYFNTANAYRLVQRFDEALSLFEKGLEIELKTMPHDPESLYSSYFTIALTLDNLNRLTDAIQACEKAVEQLLKIPQPNYELVSGRCFYIDNLRKRRACKSLVKRS